MQQQQIPGSDRPLDRPTLVRPQRTSSVIISQQVFKKIYFCTILYFKIVFFKVIFCKKKKKKL